MENPFHSKDSHPYCDSSSFEPRSPDNPYTYVYLSQTMMGKNVPRQSEYVDPIFVGKQILRRVPDFCDGISRSINDTMEVFSLTVNT